MAYLRVVLPAIILVCCDVTPLRTTYGQSLPDDETSSLQFPEGFIFSTATASYQVEGAWNVSKKGENIWDRVTHLKYPPLMQTNDTGDVACDSYHKYKTDVQMMKSLGIQMYRLSISWSRILPTGAIDFINPDGIRYYNDLINELLRNNITPMVTMFHWDLPQPLQDLGGWPNEVLVDYYVDYADVLFSHFGDRVRWWLTFNEPQSFCFGGYADGSLAPGIKADGRADYLCAHTVLKAHGRAYRLYKEKYATIQKGKVSITSLSFNYDPSNPTSPEDQAAAERAIQFYLGIFAHPIFSDEGNYPQVVIDLVEKSSAMQGLKRSRLPSFTSDEVEMIKSSADFFGLNHYSTYLTKSVDPEVNLQVRSRWNDAQVEVYLDPKLPRILATWMRVTPWGFRTLLNWIRKQYNNPEVFITENGYGDRGESLIDLDRIHYYQQYLGEMLKAMHQDGCKVIGYTAWSLMDNFEWSAGYSQRYGLFFTHFNDPARTRTPKMSSKFFEMLVRTRRIPQDDEIDFPGHTYNTPA